MHNPLVASILAAAKGVKSSSASRTVKLGRAETRIHASRSYLKLAASQPPPTVITAGQVHKDSSALQVLKRANSIGDALGGDPHGESPGLGMLRAVGGFAVDQTNVGLATKCLEAAGQSPADAAGFATTEEFDNWLLSVPARPVVPAPTASVATPPPSKPPVVPLCNFSDEPDEADAAEQQEQDADADANDE